MFCKGCRYDLRGLGDGRCPECGRVFDRCDPETFYRSNGWFDRVAVHGAHARAAIVALVVLFWFAMVMGGDSYSFVTWMISGPFIVIHLWDWWPVNALALAAGLCILAPAAGWVITARRKYLTLAIVASLLCIAVSCWFMMMEAKYGA